MITFLLWFLGIYLFGVISILLYMMLTHQDKIDYKMAIVWPYLLVDLLIFLIEDLIYGFKHK